MRSIRPAPSACSIRPPGGPRNASAEPTPRGEVRKEMVHMGTAPEGTPPTAGSAEPAPGSGTAGAGFTPTPAKEVIQ